MIMCYLLDILEAKVALPMKLIQFFSRAAASWRLSPWEFKHENLIRVGK